MFWKTKALRQMVRGRGLAGRLSLAASTSLACLAGSLAAQSSTACRTDCGLRLELVTTIGSPDGPGAEAVNSHSTVAVDGLGRVLVGPAMGLGRFSVFDQNGRFLRYVGRKGAGPGEYGFIFGIVASGEWIHVFDPMHARRTLLDTAFNVQRVDHVGAPVRQARALDSGQVAFIADIATAERVGRMIHILGPDGTMRSLGRADGGYLRRLPSHAFGADSRRAWTIPEQGVFLISEWDLATGELRREVPVEADWYERWNDDQYPRSLITGVQPWEDGLLVVGSTLDPRLIGKRVRVGDPSPPPGDLHEIMDGVLALVDPATGRSLSHLTVDGWIIGFVGDSDLIAVYRETAEGVPLIDLSRVRVEPKGGRR